MSVRLIQTRDSNYKQDNLFKSFFTLKRRKPIPLGSIIQLKSCDSNNKTDDDLPNIPISLSSSTLNSQTIDYEDENYLPQYNCSLSKFDFVLIKWESTTNPILPKRWHRSSLLVQGTLIVSTPVQSTRLLGRLLSPNTDLIEPFTWNLEGMRVVAAPDINDRMTFRVTFKQGYSCLIKANKLRLAQEWVDTLQSAVNIATDLDTRQLPIFYTLPPRFRVTRITDI